ncbi:MAG: CHASE2 domain-containing protein [bacterium]|nr:CHASE2 domain-containing protein [bacterium]
MNKSKPAKKSDKGSGIHLLIGILTSIAILALSFTNAYEDQEASTYDFRFRLRNDFFGQPEQFHGISTIDIDDLALQSHGWPFTRDRHAALIQVLNQYNASMLGFDIFFYEPSKPFLPPGEIARMEKETLSKGEVIRLIRDYDQEFLHAAQASDIVYLAQTFEVSDKDAVFSVANLRDRSTEKDAAVEVLAGSSIPLNPALSPTLYHTTDMEVPLLDFIKASQGVGFALPKPDHDGIVRRYRLVLAYDGRVYFSLSLLMACDFLQVPLENIVFIPGKEIVLPNAHLPNGTMGEIRIPVTGRNEMLVNWAGPYHTTFRHLPYNLILDFAETEPRNLALKLAKKIAVQAPEQMEDDAAYLAHARASGGADLDPQLLIEMKYVVGDCMAIEQALQNNPDLSVEDYARSLGIPEAELPAVADILGSFFSRIKNNLLILNVLAENPERSLEEVGQQMGVSHLENIKLGVGILRDLMRQGGVSAEDHPLFFLDRITSAGLHGDETADRIITASDFENTVFFYGLTATGTHDLNPTPFGAREAMLGAHVNVFNTILTSNFLNRVPHWGNGLVILTLGLMIGLLVPRFRAVPGAAVVFIILSVYLVGAFLLFAQAGIWVDALGPMSTLIIGYLSITLYNYVQKEKEKEFVQGAFGHYLDPKVIEQLVANPTQLGQLGGDQRVMTAFFSDVASFSGISENLTPVQLVELLNEYLTEMCDIIGQHGGTIDKFEGDAIIAFYGAPIPVEDHAERAVLAAIDMQNKISELRTKWETENRMVELRQMWADQGRGEFFRVRMGINTGEMVVGNMGSKTRVDYTIMGDSVNLAARLEGAGKAYGVTTMISETTYRASRQDIEVRELDSIRVVGKDEPVRVYEILGRKGQVDPEKQEVADFYAEGLAMYKARKWDDAISFFEAGLKVSPEDGPCQIFLQRCLDYKQDPPSEEWDAVHALESK